MRAWIEDDILYLHADDTPTYRKQGSIVRNNFFWALRSIAANSAMGKAWEFETAVWFALQRMLISFTDAGYLRICETQLEFREDAAIPKQLQATATWISVAEFDDESGSAQHPDWNCDRLNSSEQTASGEVDSEPKNRLNARPRPKSSFRPRPKQHPAPEARPAPPYSSYIKKQP